MKVNLVNLVLIMVVICLVAGSCKKNNTSTPSSQTSSFIGSWGLSRIGWDTNHDRKRDFWESLANNMTTKDTITYKADSTGYELGDAAWGLYGCCCDPNEPNNFTWRLASANDIEVVNNYFNFYGQIIDSLSSNYMIMHVNFNSSIAWWLEWKKK
jgi:hypothetical protein